MIRPAAFGYNTETAVNNTFQNKPGLAQSEINQQARKEFDNFVDVLRNEGIDVTVIEDNITNQKPDAVFPNNWISFHDGDTVITYPMYSSLRRLERSDDIIEELSHKFNVGHRIKYEDFEKRGQYLEGTGSMVLDRVNKIAYACISERTDIMLLAEWCNKLDYESHTFHAEMDGKPIYHTNVMMAIASNVAIVCLECLPNLDERNDLHESLAQKHEVVEITEDQVHSFAGNMLALKNSKGEELMIMSAKAASSLTTEQKTTIEKYCRIVSAPIDTIENVGGGSARCMIAEIFLEPKL